ncbi:protocadherin-9-like [Cyclopterus lumpus]|uniref:protocadherin-9-like n=1 Tax=Cyclopterus lumpus TaxID=8103 RepID=UPI001487607F|nr:protocadherin-9-like [Cyclopterus lumpus]
MEPDERRRVLVFQEQNLKPGTPDESSQPPHRRVTFSTSNQAQDLQDASQHSYYDSGLEESETPSSKSSSGPRVGPLALPEDHYERTTPDGSIGEMEHPENDLRPLPDVAMTGNCTHECTEFGHSDSCWMPGEPSPTHKLSTFVPYQEMDGQEQLMANGSPKAPVEERGTGGRLQGGPTCGSWRPTAAPTRGAETRPVETAGWRRSR